MTVSSRLIEIQGIRVAVDTLLRLRHACDPALCAKKGCCCRFYEVTFTRREVSRIIGMLPHCIPYAPALAPGNDFEHPFEKAEGNLFIVDEDEEGACAFSYRDRKGRTLCSIHSAAFDLGLDPYQVKAEACVIWPLALSEDKPPVLSVQEDIYHFPCNKRRRPGAKQLDPGVADAIRHIFGEDFLRELDAAIAQFKPIG